MSNLHDIEHMCYNQSVYVCLRLAMGRLAALGGIVSGLAQVSALMLMWLLALLSGLGLQYFLRYKPRSPGVMALILLTAFIFFEDVLFSSIFYVSAVSRYVMSFEGLVCELVWPVIGVTVVGVLGTGLLFLLIVRKGVNDAGED